jgi:hypothetical protein
MSRLRHVIAKMACWVTIIIRAKCCGIDASNVKKTKKNDFIKLMEPEVHIEKHGIDHYIATNFPYDTETKRALRRRNLLSFECLRCRQDKYLQTRRTFSLFDGVGF